MNKNDVTVNYAFQEYEYISEKELNEREVKGVSKILTYEEPRWTLKDTASALKIIKEADSSLYETIQSYIKEQHLPSENVLYLDFGKSLRYDREYMGDFSKETLSDKLDNRFIVRYSHDNDEGNLIDGGDEIIINDENIVSLFNSMIEKHVKENIQKYDEYKIEREASQKNEVWTWKDYDDLSGHLVAPDGKSYFSYDWTTKEYKVTPDSVWDSFLDADPTRDTSLTAFKEYAQKFVKENIVKNRDIKIIFEREYIDTEKWLEEEEKRMAKSETLTDKYNRMEKLFEDKLSHLGSGDGETFKELCKWVEEEFPEKDSEGVLLEATSRMIEENLDFGEFNYQAFDDVYGFGDGAEWRLDFSDSAAKELLSGEIVTLSDAQSLIWEKAEKEFAELKNNPQYKDEIEITDRINSAFRIADFLYPEFTKEIDKEKNLLPDEWPQYSNEEKKNVINNAFEKIKSAFDEKKVRLSNSRTDELVFEGSDKWLLLGDFKALIKGKDAAEHGKESLSYIRPNKEQLHDGIENGWEFDEITTGYAIFQNPDLDVKGGFTPKFISKLDDMNVFESDGDAAKQYGIDHNCWILEEKKDIWIGDEDLEYYSYPDIPENRRIMKENGWLLEQPLEFDFSEFTEKDFNRIRDELFKDNPKEDYYGRLHIGSLHVEFVINQNDGWVDTNYYILGEKGEGETQFGVPYGHFPGHQFIANLFTENTYEEFKERVTKAVLDDIAEEGTLKPEAMRPLVDWNDEQQCNELYHTKLVESARVNEIVIAPYSREERDVEAVRDFVSKIVNLPVLSVPDDMVFAVLDNIGRVQDENPGDFLKIRKDGSVEHISALGPVEKEPVEVLHIINSFAEDHASVSEEGSQQRKDYEYVNSLYEKSFERYVHAEKKEFVPSKYVLEKLKEKGFEVIADKEIFNELLKATHILQKMETSQTENISDKYFQANKSEAEAFAKELDVFVASVNSSEKPINPLKMLNVGSISPVMKVLGIADVPVQIEQSTVSKALREEPLYPNDKQGHKLAIDELKTIPQSLADPVMVFRSDSPTRRQRDSYVFFTEHRDFKGRSVIIPIAVNKKFGRIVINKINSIYGRNEEVGYVKDNIKRGNLVYFDKKRSLEWERECKVQFLAQVLPAEGSINNILSKDSLVKFLESKTQNMIHNGTTYGFAYEGKIYLNPDTLGTEVAVHEYTHLWDNLTRKDNPELWNKGLQIFKGTSLWNEVVNDENYQDIKDDENLVLSECHARITGKVTEAVLNRIAEQDGTAKQAEMIDWDKETINFIFDNYRDVFAKNGFETVAEFAAASMRELFSPVEQHKRDISINSSALKNSFKKLVEPKIVQLLDTPELLAEKMNAQRIHQNEPEITKEQAGAILDYCNYENIKFYCDKNGDIFSLDVSEDYNGEGLKEDNFGIVENGIEYARKAKDLNYSCYSTATFNTVSELWQKERQFVNPSVENISNAKEKVLNNLKAELLDTAIENNIKEYLRREYAETYPNSGKFEVTVENQSYPIDKDGLDYIANSDEWGSVEDRLNDVIDRRFEEEIEQKENDILSDVKEYIAQETNGNLILKDSELGEILFSDELVQIYAPKEDFLANQPEEVKAALVEAGIARSELYNNVESIPVSEEARKAILSASNAGQGGTTQKAFADNGIEIDLETANALENCFSQIEAMTKYTSDGHDLFHSGNGVDTISEHTIEYSEKDKAWFVHEKNWLALSAIKGNEAEPEDYMEKAGRVGDRNWALSCEELVKYVYQEIKEDGEMEKEFPDTFKKLEKLNEYLEAPERIKENGFLRRKEDYFANIKVSTENFRDVFNEVIKLPKFKDKPLEAASWCFSKVPKENKAEVAQWFSNLGCKTKKDTNKLFNKWNKENNPKLNVNKSKNNDKDDWSISD